MDPARWETVIGLEVHAQLRTATKMFCACRPAFGEPPNTRTCPVCLGHPGALPALNSRAVEYGVRTALALGARVHTHSRFARKHYYYPDMPKNYQISQYEEPLATGGGLEVELTDGAVVTVVLERLHLEEDVGKLIHEGALAAARASLVDYNRAGLPLMETVTRPDLRSPAAAALWLREFRAVLVALGVSGGSMEAGSLRCDANISLRAPGQAALGTKVEIKNLNSFRHLERALEFEAGRQATLLERGERVRQETRLWDAERGVTLAMRSKEQAHDYRYFPEPDLPPLVLARDWIEALATALPELPRARRRRLVAQHGLPVYDAAVLTQSPALADYFEAAVALFPRPKAVSNWVMSELLRVVDGSDADALGRTPVTPARLAALLALVEAGTISGRTAKQVFDVVAETGEEPAAVVERAGLAATVAFAELEAVVADVIAANPRPVDDFRRGKRAAAKALVGLVLRATGGKADPATVSRLVEEKLSEG